MWLAELYALDNISLMALVVSGWACGLMTAIVMIENISRHIEEGMTGRLKPQLKRRQREITFTVTSNQRFP